MGLRLELGERLNIADRVAYPQLYCDVCNEQIEGERSSFNVEIKENKPEQIYFVHKECSYILAGKVGNTEWQDGEDFFKELINSLGLVQEVA